MPVSSGPTPSAGALTENGSPSTRWHEWHPNSTNAARPAVTSPAGGVSLQFGGTPPRLCSSFIDMRTPGVRGRGPDARSCEGPEHAARAITRSDARARMPAHSPHAPRAVKRASGPGDGVADHATVAHGHHPVATRRRLRVLRHHHDGGGTVAIRAPDEL